MLGREQQQLSSSVRVVVSVRDEDDLNPIFTTAVFTASVLESDTAVSGRGTSDARCGAGCLV